MESLESGLRRPLQHVDEIEEEIALPGRGVTERIGDRGVAWVFTLNNPGK